VTVEGVVVRDAGAEVIHVPHDSLKPGCKCPSCLKGKLHLIEPGKVLRILGQAFLRARVYIRTVNERDLPPTAQTTLRSRSVWLLAPERCRIEGEAQR
jgi:hypothetical protein